MTAQEAGLRVRPLAVGSYNIHRCYGTDGRYLPERIVEIVRNLACDVVGLQEVDKRFLAGGSGQRDFIARQLDMTAVGGANYEDRRARYGTVLLTRLPVQRVRSLNLTVRNLPPRDAVIADLELEPRLPLRVAVAHLGLRLAERRLQVRHLLHALDDLPGDPLTVVMGDFNEWKGGGALRELNRRLGSVHLPRTFPARLPLLPLDRIWVWPPTGLRRLSVYATPIARLASDHLPLRAEVVWDRGDLPLAWKNGTAVA